MSVIGSKTAAWSGLVLTVVVIVIMSVSRTVWWTFIPVFFMFMASFAGLASMYLGRISPSASKKLGTFALAFGILAIAGILAVFLAIWSQD